MSLEAATNVSFPEHLIRHLYRRNSAATTAESEPPEKEGRRRRCRHQSLSQQSKSSVDMVQTDKITGQMVLSDDGTIITSSGDLSSNEATSQQVVGLINSTFPIALKGPVLPAQQQQASTNGQAVAAASKQSGSNNTVINGSDNSEITQQSNRVIRPFYWKSITIDFGTHSYVACLSNRKIHVVKREKVHSMDQDQE